MKNSGFNAKSLIDSINGVAKTLQNIKPQDGGQSSAPPAAPTAHTASTQSSPQGRQTSAELQKLDKEVSKLEKSATAVASDLKKQQKDKDVQETVAGKGLPSSDGLPS